MAQGVNTQNVQNTEALKSSFNINKLESIPMEQHLKVDMLLWRRNLLQ